MKYELTNAGRGNKIDKALLRYIPNSEIEKINEVLESMRGEGISESSVQDKYRTPLIQMRYLLDKDFMACSREDLKQLNVWIINSKYKVSRRRQIRTALKRAYRVWFKVDDDEELEIIKDLKPTKKERKAARKERTYMPEQEDLIKTDSDMDIRVMRYIKSDRDKAEFGIKWDTAARDCEAETSKWDAIKTINGITRMTFINGKDSGDEKDRTIPLLYSLPYINRWKRQFMEIFGIEKEEDLKGLYIFRKPGPKNEPLTHGHYAKLCKEIKKKNGIKDFSSKMIRKYVISAWERMGIPDALIRKMSGHAKYSRAIQHYSYHDQEAVDEAILKTRGIEIKKEETEDRPPFIICKRCQSHNIADVESCEVCGYPLNQKRLLDYEQKIDNSTKITEDLIRNNESLRLSIIATLKKQITDEIKAEIEQMQKIKSR